MFDSSGTRRMSRAAPCSVFDVRARIYVFFSRFALSVLTQTPLIIIIIIIVSIYSRLNDTQEEHSEEEEEEEEHEDGTFKLCFVLVCSFVVCERSRRRKREREILILENLSFSPEGFALGFSVASDLGIIDGKAIALNVIQLGPVVCFVVAFGFCVV